MNACLKKILLFLTIGFLLFLILIFWFAQRKLISLYLELESKIILDREGREIAILPNKKGNFARYLENIPPKFKELLVKKEDKYFYYHFGINPISSFRAAFSYLNLSKRRASSTITQQLVKILLDNEFKRSLKNKIIESFYAVALEIFHSKEKILKMYANSLYLGNQAQGIAHASYIYFGVSPEILSDGQILQILATISSPTEQNPTKEINKNIANNLAKKFNLTETNFFSAKEVKENIKKDYTFDESFFEIKDLLSQNSKKIKLTIDRDLNKKIREIVKKNLSELKEKKANNAAVLVILLEKNEVLAFVGSPDPHSFDNGAQINMIFKPRAAGSTIKPFIYLKAFEKGLRPYTLVDDREYKYTTAIGFPLYPRNFDFQYRGIVDLHYALANSLNVPTVKVLEYVGIKNFANFFENDLEFKPIQDWNDYQLAIALGGLEISLWDLGKFFTIFPNNGILKEIKILKDNSKVSDKIIVPPQYTQLVNKILADRKTAIDQFGLLSNLNLPFENYALKTGTSRNFIDSWIVGFTPDFLVGVWVGNADNEPMDALSGQKGAGKIWSEVMELLLNSKYNKKTPFNFDLIEEFTLDGKIKYGLKDDNYEKIKNILTEIDKSLILNPHHNDLFLFEENSKIVLKAKKEVEWFVNGIFFEKANETIFIPPKSGHYQIRAETDEGDNETITIYFISK